MPDQKIVNDYFSNHEIELQPFKLQYEMLEKVVHSLSKIMGYYEAGEQFKFIRINSQGQLHVTSDQVGVNTGTISRVAVGAAATLLIGANSNRRDILIQNVGDDDFYLGFTNSVTTGNGFLISPGVSWSSNIYTGALYGIRAGAIVTTAHLMEF